MTVPRPIVGVLLAGGRSSRFGGGDKGLAALGGDTLIARARDRLRPQVDILVLNVNGDPTRFGALALPVVADDANASIGAFAGPLAGLLAGMMWADTAEPTARFIVTAAIDTPFFPRDLVARLIGGAGPGGSAIASSAGGTHPVFGLWPVTLAGELRADLQAGHRKALAFAERQGAKKVWFGPETIGGTEIDPFFNINRPEDFALAEALLAKAKG